MPDSVDDVLGKAVATAEGHAKKAEEAATRADASAQAATATKTAMDGVVQEEAKKKQKSNFAWALVVTGILTAACLAGAAKVGFTVVDLKEKGDFAGRMQIATFVCCIGMAFAVLGFGLFLIGATGTFTGNASGNGKVVKVETAAPGLVVMVCATVVIYLGLDALNPPAPKGVDAPPAQTEEPPGPDAALPAPDAALAAPDAP